MTQRGASYIYYAQLSGAVLVLESIMLFEGVSQVTIHTKRTHLYSKSHGHALAVIAVGIIILEGLLDLFLLDLVQYLPGVYQPHLSRTADSKRNRVLDARLTSRRVPAR